MNNQYYKYINSTKDFPKPGVIFRDFTPLLLNPDMFNQAVNDIIKHFSKTDITKIAAVEAKGFIIGSILAKEMKKPLTLIRKPNLIPGKILSQKFTKEYGQAEYQIKFDAYNKNDKVLIVYDIMAGSGATKAVIDLIKKNGAKVAGCAYIIELEYLEGRKSLEGYNLFSLVKIKNEKGGLNEI